MSEPTTPAPEVTPEPTPEPRKTAPWYAFMTNLQSVAQFGHFFGALSIIYLTSVFFGVMGLWRAFSVGFLYALWKEFWFDIRKERDTWSNSVMDFAFMLAGGLAAVGFFYLSVYLQKIAP